jgi:hypothetical protein
MQHNSTKYQISGLFVFVSGMYLSALQYSEFEEVIGFIPYDIREILRLSHELKLSRRKKALRAPVYNCESMRLSSFAMLHIPQWSDMGVDKI